MKSLILKGIGIARDLLDKVEDKLEEHPEPLPPPPEPSLPPPCVEGEEPAALPTFEDRAPMNDLLRAWGRASGHTIKELKALLRPHMGVARIAL